jgi:hypothetical protein
MTSVSGLPTNHDMNYAIPQGTNSSMQHWGDGQFGTHSVPGQPLMNYYKPDDQPLPPSMHYGGGGNLVRDVSFDSGMELESCVSIGSYTNFHFNARQSLNIDGFSNQDSHGSGSTFPHNEHQNVVTRQDTIDLYSSFREDSYSENSDDFSNESVGDSRTSATLGCVLPVGPLAIPFPDTCPSMRPTHQTNGIATTMNHTQSSQSQYGELYFGSTPDASLFLGNTSTPQYHGSILHGNSTPVVGHQLNLHTNQGHYSHPQQTLEFQNAMSVPETSLNIRQHFPEHFTTGQEYFQNTNSFNPLGGTNTVNGFGFGVSQPHPLKTMLEGDCQGTTPILTFQPPATSASIESSVMYSHLHTPDPLYASGTFSANPECLKEHTRNGFETIEQIDHDSDALISSKESVQNIDKELDAGLTSDNLGEIIKKSMVETVSA